ncbi:MAG TPA: LamG domain-containing protein, partial [Jatrophihabitans sp.]|nr:LamG domain-containing protein [Jatrophihabitans sp.]
MRIRRLLAGITTVGAGVLGLVGIPPAAALQGTVPGNAASSWQTNGAVSAIAAANGVVYLGGDFTSVRPPGTAAGSGEVARNHLAAFDASTGALITSFNHNVNAAVKVLSISADGQTLYAGGDFTSIDGTTRNRIAAFTASSGALTSFNPNANGRVAGIAATASTIYVAGEFSTIGGRTERRVAALNPSTGAALAGFTTTPDNVVYQIALTPAGDKLYLAGAFLSVNGDTSYHAVAAVDTATGANLPLPAASVIPPKTDSCIVEAKSVKTDAAGAYFGVEGTGGGCFDGTFAVNNADGSLRWQSMCLGATQAVQPIGDILYTGSHSHDCSADQAVDPDSFPEIGWSKGLSRHLLSRTISGGLLASWYANTNGGPNGAGLGPRVMATDGSQLFVGGEFTTVNGLSQQGFARFSPATGDLTAPARPPAPTVVARGGGKVSIFVQAPLDIDDTDLTVRLYRDGAATPIATAAVHSLFWKQPVLAFSDDGLALGSSHSYTADAVEAFGSNAGSKSAASRAVTVLTTPPAYEAAVAQDDPVLDWRLGDAAGPLTADSSASKNAGLAFGGTAVGFGTAGAVAGNTAITTNGSTGYVSSTARQDSPSSFSVETWFRTTSTSGGKIIGFGDQQGGLDFNGNPTLSGAYDKQIYLTNDGRVVFGVWVGFADTLTSANAYNDGQWHHVVGSQGPQGLTLYVDGAKAAHDGQTQNQSYSGYWRIGGDNLGGWPNQPASNFFAGAIDETAVYDHALSLTSVRNHYAASGRTPPPAAGPTDSYGKAVYNDAPATYWRLDETTGSTAADSSDNASTGTYVGGVVQGAGGALGSTGRAATFDGSSGNVALNSQRGGPSAYSTELWFSSSTTSGGKLIGFGNAQTGLSGNYDKQVYLTNDGRLVFGVYNNGFDTVYSPAGLADGQWHQVVASQGPTGMRLYVDNHLVGSNAASANQAYSGYWRVGGDNLNAWPDQPSSAYFAGTIDEVAIYDSVLSAAQVDAHYTASGRGGGADAVPP